MVYCGKPSKACAECRLRRTKVSEAANERGLLADFLSATSNDHLALSVYEQVERAMDTEIQPT